MIDEPIVIKEKCFYCGEPVTDHDQSTTLDDHHLCEVYAMQCGDRLA